jgi:predicted phage terminase large subunit-like protein
MSLDEKVSLLSLLRAKQESLNHDARRRDLEVRLRDRDKERSRLLSDYGYFYRQAWPWTEGNPLMWNWHLKAICSHLQALQSGSLFRDLIIAQPPGSGKSQNSMVIWPAWCFAKNPGERMLTASYDYKQVCTQSTASKTLMQSEWYQAFFGDRTQIDPKVNRQGEWNTTAGGWRIATTPKGRGTGLHPSILAIDDSLSAEQAALPGRREFINTWWDRTMSSRGAGKQLNRRRLVMGQRLHEKDLPGHIMANENWAKLVLPMEYDSAISVSFTGLPGDPRTVHGDLLWPARFDATEIKNQKRRLGNEYPGQYQQRPVAEGGNVFKIDRIHVIAASEVPFKRLHRVIRAWDKSSTLGGGCYTAGVLMGIVFLDDNHIEIYILNVVRGQWDVVGVESQIKFWAKHDELKYGAHRFETVFEQEPGASGKQAAAETIRKLRGRRIRAVPTKGKPKESRYSPFAGAIGEREVYLCTDNQWAADFINELELVPKGEYVDQADAASLAYYELVNPGVFDLPDADQEPGGSELMPSELTCVNSRCDRLASPESLYCCCDCEALDGGTEPMASREDLHQTKCNHRHGELYRRSLWTPNGQL